jgi:hypothetical protein
MDRNRHLKDSVNYLTGSVSFAFSLQNRNNSPEDQNSYINIANENDLMYVTKKHRYLIINNLRYFNSSGGTFISTGYAHLRAHLMRHKKISYENFAQWQYDASRNMNLRFLIGGGGRLALANTKKVGAFTGIGIMYEKEEWETLQDENQVIVKELAKLTSYQSLRWQISDIMELHVVLYYQTGHDPAVDRFRHRLGPNADYTLEITDKLSFQVSFSGIYESDPIIPIQKFIYTLENGITLNF